MFLPLTDPLAATFNEAGASTSKTYVAEIGIMMPNLSKAFPIFCSHFSVFSSEKQHKYLNFQNVITSNRPFGGYFQ